MPFSLVTAADRVRAAASLPTTERGSILPPHMGGPVVPGWSVWETQARTIKVEALRWPKSRDTYEDMTRDPQIQGLLMSVFLPIRHMDWYVDPRGTTGTVAEEIAEDFGLRLDGDEQHDEDGPGVDYDEHLRLALLALAHGHKPFEEAGVIEGEGDAQKYRLRHLHERPNDTIERIHITGGGDLLSIRVPSADPAVDGPSVDIPAEHLLYYCWDRRGGDWGGRPLTYGLYRAWLLKDELIREDATMTRRFGGIPVVETTDINVGEGALEKAALMAQAVQAGDGAGVATPFGTRLRILGVEGTLPQPLNSAKYHDGQMSRAFMQMVMELGNTEHGSRALGGTLMDHFDLGVLAIAKWVRKTQMTLVRRIVERNYGPGAPLPHIRWRADEHADIPLDTLTNLIDSGAITVDDALEAQIRERGNLVPRNSAQAGRVPASQVPSTAPTAAGPLRAMASATASTGNTGVMVALYPPTGVATALALPDGEVPEQLHVTLAFLGKADDLEDPVALHAAVRIWAADQGAFVGEVSGAGLFTQGPDAPVTYLSVDLPTLPQARQDLIGALEAAGLKPAANHGFAPHMTLAYSDRVSDVDTGGTMLSFTDVAVVIADERTDYQLGDGATASIALDIAETVVDRFRHSPVPARRLPVKRHHHPTATTAPEPAVDSPIAPAQVDFEALQTTHADAVAELNATWRGVQAALIADLHTQIAGATTVAEVANITPAVLGGAALAAVLVAVLVAVVAHGAQTATDEAAAQGATLPELDLTDTQAQVVEAANATAVLLCSALGQSASSAAVATWGPMTDPPLVADAVQAHLEGLAGVTADYELSGLSSQAQNAGRDAVFANLPDGTRWYASSVLEDPNRCDACAEEDDTEFESLADARRDFPLGRGTYIGCAGSQRCRCTLVAVLPSEAT